MPNLKPNTFPRVSVIMPVFNHEQFLAESIVSVLQQTMEDFEFIIVDDASDDKCPEIIALYASFDDRIKHHTLPVNMGQAHATNYGAKFAKGEYMAWHHSDDNYHPEFLEKLLATGADVAYSAFAQFTIDGEVTRYGTDLDNFTFDLERFKSKCYLSCQVMIYKRSIFEELGGYDDSFETCTDWDFSLRACQAARTVELVPEVLGYYREWHPQANRRRISESIRNDNRRRIRQKYGVDDTDLESIEREENLKKENNAD